MAGELVAILVLAIVAAGVVVWDQMTDRQARRQERGISPQRRRQLRREIHRTRIH